LRYREEHQDNLFNDEYNTKMSVVPLASAVLVVDDDPQQLSMLSGMISSFGYQVEAAVDGQDALSKLNAAQFAVIVTDLVMPRMDGFQFLRTLNESDESTPAIVLTAFGNITDAVSVVHDLGAFWFLEKPVQPAALGALLDRAIRYNAVLKEKERLQRELSHQGMLGDLVGSSDAMRQVYTLIQRVAPVHASVLITGESGTGKEMAARTIHKLSPRASFPFVAINCAALPEELIESELFGHEKGAFTGATGRHIGCFEQANEGTLLLDEIGEMPAAMQARLLRALEESKVRRLGGTAEIPVNVRVLAATNRNVEDEVARRCLREDLYYRLNVFHLNLPPLRERKDDLCQLINVMITDLNRKHECKVTACEAATLEVLAAHAWPGNVRELRNVLEFAVITAREGPLMPHHLPKSVRSHPSPVKLAAPEPNGSGFPVGLTLEEVEHDYILQTLEATKDKKKTAEILGISLRTLYNRLAAAPQKKSMGTSAPAAEFH